MRVFQLIVLIIILSLTYSFLLPFVIRKKFSLSSSFQKSTILTSTSLSSSSSSSSSFEGSSSSKEDDEFDDELKKEAMDMLECLTSPRDENHPEYNIDKDIRRDELLAEVDYSDLKIELRRKGLRTKGDKIEMMMRILLNVIDPTINFDELSGREATLKFVDKDDISSERIKVIPADQRVGYSGVLDEMGPDAEDLKVLRRRVKTSANNKVGGGLGYDDSDVELASTTEKELVIMDGLTRREIEFPCISAQRLLNTSRIEDKDISIRAYIVGGRDVLKTWEKNSAVIVVLGDELGWKSKPVRVFADELAFSNQAIVIVPDIFRGESFKVPPSDNPESTDLLFVESRDISYLSSPEYQKWLSDLNYERIFDDVVATLQYSNNEYKSQSLSVAGIGIGAEWALRISNDLSDISALAVYKSLVQGTKTRFAPQNFLDLSEDITKGLMPDTNQIMLKSMDDEIINELLTTFENEMSKELNNSNSNNNNNTLNDIFFNSATSNFYESKEEWILRRDEVEKERRSIEQKRIAIASQRALKIMKEETSISIQQLASLEPKAILAICPSSNNIEKLALGVRAATMIVYSNSGKEDGIKFHSLLESRSYDIVDYSIRIYDVKDSKFCHDPLSDDDKKCSEDAISIGSIWLDAYSRNFDSDATDETGKTKSSSSSSLTILTKEDMIIPIRGTTVATYLHDDPKTLANDNLDSDSILKKKSLKNQEKNLSDSKK